MIRILREWVEMFDPGPGDAKARRDKQRMLNMLDASDGPFSRKQFDPGHVTVSALILSPDLNDVLIVRNAKLNRWLQPGGHLEAGDLNLADAARREAAEETGVALDEKLGVPMIGIDVHPIPAHGDEPAHSHYDVMMAFRALSRDVKPSAETPEVEWTPIAKAVAPDRLGERFAPLIERAKTHIK